MSTTGETIFFEKARAFEIKSLEEELEDMVLLGFNIRATRRMQKTDLDGGIEERMESVIEAILQHLDPKEFRNVLGLGALKAGSLYWDLRKKPGDPSTPFLEFLGNLETDLEQK